MTVRKQSLETSKICGMLIGSGGKRIKEIQAKTGALGFSAETETLKSDFVGQQPEFSLLSALFFWCDWDRSQGMEASISDVKISGTTHSFNKRKTKELQ